MMMMTVAGGGRRTAGAAAIGSSTSSSSLLFAGGRQRKTLRPLLLHLQQPILLSSSISSPSSSFSSFFLQQKLRPSFTTFCCSQSPRNFAARATKMPPQLPPNLLSTTADAADVIVAPSVHHHQHVLVGQCAQLHTSSAATNGIIENGGIAASNGVHRAAYTQTNGAALPPPLQIEELDGADAGIIVARMCVPPTRNAFSRALVKAMRDMVDRLRYGKETRALILGSAVPGTFCAGVDLKERRQMSANEVFTFVDGLRRTLTDLAELPFPTIAAIDGFALGGGLELALACDIRIATPHSKLGLTETRLAIIPGCGGTQRLPRVVGVAKAKELILTGKQISGDEAERIGLLNHVTKDPLAKALEIARDVLKTGPLANRMAKLAVEQGFDLELRSGLVVEQQCYAQLMPTKDRLEALEAFAQKRPPKYKGE